MTAAPTSAPPAAALGGLDPAPKHAGAGAHRVVPAEKTWRRIRPLLERAGVTRLADITHLDRIGIPTYAAIVPDSDDVLSVYNGKGVRKLDAKVGAAMEALERQSALRLELPLVTGTFAELSRRQRALDPARLVLGLFPEDAHDSPYACVRARDLATREAVLVPAQAATLVFDPRFGHPQYAYGSSNGLAAGNTIEEAICHALCELIERDAWTLADLRARRLPEALRAHGLADGLDLPPRGDDLEAFPAVDLTGAPRPIPALAGAFERAGLTLRLKDLTSDIGVATLMATVAETVGDGFVMAHFGLGTHPDARVAIARALTEVAQSRVVDIQGVREDLGNADAETHIGPAHTQRLRRIREGSWYHGDPRRSVAWHELPHHPAARVRDDIELMAGRLAARGLDEVLVVELTRADLVVPVVRVLVPGLESWGADGGRTGERAAACWRAAQMKLRGRG